jgi:hypothetical protein
MCRPSVLKSAALGWRCFRCCLRSQGLQDCGNVVVVLLPSLTAFFLGFLSGPPNCSPCSFPSASKISFKKYQLNWYHSLFQSLIEVLPFGSSPSSFAWVLGPSMSPASFFAPHPTDSHTSLFPHSLNVSSWPVTLCLCCLWSSSSSSHTQLKCALL